MNLTIDIPDNLARALQAKAHEEGISPDRYISRVLEDTLASQPAEPIQAKPLKTGYGMWASFGPAPSAEDIDENRREMFRNFAENF